MKKASSFKFEETLQRQWDIIPMEVLNKKITIIGAGAIGSWTALALAKMGFLNLEVWDDDVIDVENMNCQFYPIDSIGKKKVVALALMIKYFTGHKITVHDERYEGTPIVSDIVIASVDDMKVRKNIWENSKATWHIDPRMGAETALLYVMKRQDANDIVTYEKTLHTDEEGVQERCTAKATIYCANILSGLAVNAVKAIATDRPHTRIIQGNFGGADNILQSWGKK